MWNSNYNRCESKLHHLMRAHTHVPSKCIIFTCVSARYNLAYGYNPAKCQKTLEMAQGGGDVSTNYELLARIFSLAYKLSKIHTCYRTSVYGTYTHARLCMLRYTMPLNQLFCNFGQEISYKHYSKL